MNAVVRENKSIKNPKKEISIEKNKYGLKMPKTEKNIEIFKFNRFYFNQFAQCKKMKFDYHFQK